MSDEEEIEPLQDMEGLRKDLINAVKENMRADAIYWRSIRVLALLIITTVAIIYCTLEYRYCLFGVVVFCACMCTSWPELAIPLVVSIVLWVYFEWNSVHKAIVVFDKIRDLASD